MSRVGSWLWRWRLVHGFYMTPEEVDLYQLDRGGRDPVDFVGYRFFNRVMRPLLNHPEARVLTDNKWIFYQLARSLGLPVPRTLALYDKMFGVTIDGHPCVSVEQVTGVLESEQPKSLVIKPAGGIQGREVLIFEEVDYATGRARLRTGEEVNLWDEIRGLPETRRATGSGYVIQEGVPQHPVLSRINPHTTNTVRVVTHMTRDGDVLIPFAAVRLGRAGSMADNWEQGGVSVGIDIDSGSMMHGVLKPKHGGQWVSSHPGTGVEFVGTQIPTWQDTIALCRHAARLFPGVRSIGWDIIITPQGPILLEGNENWGLEVVQAHSEGWLTQTAIRNDLTASGIALPDHVPTTIETLTQIGKRKLTKLGLRLASSGT